MRPDELTRSVQDTPPAGVFVLTAASADSFDPHVADESVDTIVSALLSPEERQEAVSVFSGDECDLGTFLAACQTLPMFSPHNVVLCRHAEKLSADTQAAIQDAFASLPDPTVVILVAPKLDARLKFTKFLKKQAQWVDVGTSNDPAALAVWAKQRFAALDKTIDDRLAYTLASKVGRLGALAAQVEQIALYLGDAPAVSREAVEALWRAEPTDNVFAITDALADQDGAAALAALTEAERAGAHYLQLLALIESAVRRLVGVRQGMDAGLSDDAIAQQLGVKKGAVYHQRRRAQRWSLEELRALHRRVLELEYQTKSGGGNPHLRMESFLVAACR